MADEQYDHIGDTDTVFMRSPLNEGVGSCLGRAFKLVHGPNGYTQISQREWEEGMAKLDEERDQFAVGGRIAPLPDGEPEAQDVINAERGKGDVVPQRTSLGGGDVPAEAPVSSSAKTAKHAGEG
jgi:hypothetical protein